MHGVVPNQQGAGGHDVRVGECLLPTASRFGLEDEDAFATEAERAVLVVFSVHGILAGRIFSKIYTVNAQIADGEVLVHVEKRAVDRRYRVVFPRHLGGFRAARLMREPKRILRRVRDFQHEELLVRVEEPLPVERALPQHHAV